MEDKRKNAVLEILNYWKITEFLGQTDIPQESTENKKLIKISRKAKRLRQRRSRSSLICQFCHLLILIWK